MIAVIGYAPCWTAALRLRRLVLACTALALTVTGPGVAAGESSLQRSERIAREWIETEHVAGPTWGEPQFDFSEDGTLLAFVSVRADVERNTYVYRLWLRSIGANPTPDRLIDEVAASSAKLALTPRFSRLDNSLVYIRPMGSGGAAIIVASAAGERLHEISGEKLELDGSLAGLASARWSPDGRHISVLAAHMPTRPVPTSGIDTPSTWDPITSDWHSAKNRLIVLERDGTNSRVLTGRDVDVLGYDWSPDGSRIVYSAADGLEAIGSKYGLEQHSDLFILERSTGQTVRAVSQPGPDTDPVWSPDGGKIAFLSQAGTAGYRGTPGIRSDVAILTLRSGEVTYPLRDHPSLREFELQPPSWVDRRTLAFNVNMELSTVAMLFDVERGSVRPLSSERPVAQGRARAAGDRRVAYVSQNVTRPPDLYVAGLADLRATALTQYRDNVQTSHMRVDIVEWSNPDTNDRIPGIVIEPFSRPEEDRPRPLFVYLDGGPNAIVGSWGVTRAFPLFSFVELGAAVFVPSGRGRGGVSASFSTHYANTLDRHAGPIEDMLSGVDLLVGRRRVDACRMAVGGYSYGGYLTAHTIGRTNRFSGAHILEGVSTLELADRMKHAANPILNGILPWLPSPYDSAGRTLFINSSPFSSIHRARTPTMLEYGMQESGGFDFHDGVLLFQALRHFQVPSLFIRYPRTGHVLTEPRLRLESAARNLAWFSYWTLGKPNQELEARFGKVVVRKEQCEG